MAPALRAAPEFEIQKWLNTDQPCTLEALRGKVVVVYAFQMLCPGCVEHSVPQARKVRALFPAEDVAVLGLHTVFEHHEAMGEIALKAFLHEYRLDFPVGIDEPSGDSLDPVPKTMRRYNLQGTPTTLMIDRQGRLRKQKFGHEQDMVLGAEIMALMREAPEESLGQQAPPEEKTPADTHHCSDESCPL
ncbi:MAG: redoxin family protein [Alphaproteobacteria bacterium]|nr:redoxin family protein [Alphaproteobacteria bacterium]